MPHLRTLLFLLTDTTAVGISDVTIEVDGRNRFSMNRDEVNQLLALSPIHYNLSSQFGFFVPLNANNDPRDFITLVNPDGTRKSVKLSYTFAGTPAPIRILMEGLKGTPADKL